MNTHAGLWIDHRKAVVVILADDGETLQEIPSGVEKHVRFSGGTNSEPGAADDIRDRQFEQHLNAYYDKVIALVRDARLIQIFGPGEAKGELAKRLAHAGLSKHVLAIESADKMSYQQVTDKVRARFTF
jgi:hypothetical protein